MSFVTWDESKKYLIDTTIDDPDLSERITFSMLKRSPQTRAWRGKVRIKNSKLQVELRCNLGGADVLMIIKQPIHSRYMRRSANLEMQDKWVKISMNAGILVSLEDLEDMNLAAGEGKSVFEKAYNDLEEKRKRFNTFLAKK